MKNKTKAKLWKMRAKEKLVNRMTSVLTKKCELKAEIKRQSKEAENLVDEPSKTN